MANYRMTVRYEGTRYAGWQSQPDSKTPSVQEKLEDVLSRMVPDNPYPVHVISAGRTDAGVHAFSQTANVHLETSLSCGQIRAYLNRYLPEDIGIVDCREADDRFHARFSALDKTYGYRIALDPAAHVFERRLMTPVSEMFARCGVPEETAPDVSAMREAAGFLTGTHDFAAFCTRRTKKSTVRTLFAVKITESPTELTLSFTGDGFLYNMVRILTGTLFECGAHVRRPESVRECLERPERALSGFTAPAKGLTLLEVRYPGD